LAIASELCLSRVALSGPMAGGSVGPPPPLRKGGRGENNANVPRNLPVPLGTKALLKSDIRIPAAAAAAAVMEVSGLHPRTALTNFVANL